MVEIILLIKRLPQGDFEGDNTWQVAPYPIVDRAHAERLIAWLARSMPDIEFDHRIVEN